MYVCPVVSDIKRLRCIVSYDLSTSQWRSYWKTRFKKNDFLQLAEQPSRRKPRL